MVLSLKALQISLSTPLPTVHVKAALHWINPSKSQAPRNSSFLPHLSYYISTHLILNIMSVIWHFMKFLNTDSTIWRAWGHHSRDYLVSRWHSQGTCRMHHTNRLSKLPFGFRPNIIMSKFTISLSQQKQHIWDSNWKNIKCKQKTDKFKSNCIWV